MPRLWDTLSREDKAKLKARMPEGWYPPRRKPRKTKVEGKLESTEELARLMKEVPGFCHD